MMLKSLAIKNFRILEDFKVDKLGRVNLIVGKNNSGKSSVLEALRIYAGNARSNILNDIALGHDEEFRRRGDDEVSESKTDLPYESFFTGRRFPVDETAIQIGETEPNANSLKILYGYQIEWKEDSVPDLLDPTKTSTVTRREWMSEDEFLKADFSTMEERTVTKVLLVLKGDKGIALLPIMLSKTLRSEIGADLSSIPCSSIPTQFVSMDELADAWDAIALTDYEATVKEALQIISLDLEAIAFVRDEGDLRGITSRRPSSRSAKVKLRNHDRPVPFRSLGDGMLRILQLVLKILPAKGGFLLIDEFENGLHYSVQEKVWQLIFELAEKLDIQVFATTHSWDCISSFAKVAAAKTQTEGVLFRVGRSARTSDKDKVIATVFDEQQLINITQADVEVR